MEVNDTKKKKNKNYFKIIINYTKYLIYLQNFLKSDKLFFLLLIFIQFLSLFQMRKMIKPLIL